MIVISANQDFVTMGSNLKRSMRNLARERFPKLWDYLLRKRNGSRIGLAYRVTLNKSAFRRAKKTKVLRIKLTGVIGLGGILGHGITACAACRRKGITPFAECYARTYLPEGKLGDWFSAYFSREHKLPPGSWPSLTIRSHEQIDFLLPSPSLEEARESVVKDFPIQEKICELVDSFVTQNLPSSFLAVHVRGTDKVTEAEAFDTNHVVNVVMAEIERAGNPSSIFLATDDPKFENLLKEKLSPVSVVTFSIGQDMRSGSAPVHHSNFPGELKAREALALTLILSKAHVLVRTASLLSATSVLYASEIPRVVMLNRNLPGKNFFPENCVQEIAEWA